MIFVYYKYYKANGKLHWLKTGLSILASFVVYALVMLLIFELSQCRIRV
jgi:hypothetical protein